MAKKKNYPMVVGAAEYSSPPLSDNNPSSGLVGQPNASIVGYGYKDGTNRKCMPCAVADGECKIPDDVVVNTANGIARSRGKNPGAQYNWGDTTDGVWNNNDFDDTNMTGM